MRLPLAVIAFLLLSLLCWLAIAVECRTVEGVVTRRHAEMRTFSLCGVRYVDARYLLTVRGVDGDEVQADVPVRQYGLTHPGDWTRVVVIQRRGR